MTLKPWREVAIPHEDVLKALRTLEHHFARLQALWKPVATEEAFEIVRRRLFSAIQDERMAEAVGRAFAAFYRENAADLPAETQEGGYLERMQRAYPFHPEVFVRLYEDWLTLEHSSAPAACSSGWPRRSTACGRMATTIS